MSDLSNMRTYVAEDHRLSDSDSSVDIGERLKLALLILTLDVVLLYVVKAFLFASQPNDDWIRDDLLCKNHHILVVRRGKEQHLTVRTQTSKEQQQE